MTEETSARIVNRDLVRGLVAFAEGKLREQLAQCTEPRAISAETRKGIVKRVAPKNVAEFSDPEKLPILVSLELATLAERIRLYPFVAQYRTVIPRDMMVAWMLHSHSLRQSELYIIQERSIEFLKFLREVATNLGLPADDKSKSFGKAFKNRFERRLRERHRLVHAHERPSLTSRLIDFGVAAEEKDRDLIEETLVNLMVDIAQMLPGKPAENPRDLQERVNALRDSYPTIANQEAIEMFELLAKEVANTLRTPFGAPPVRDEG